MNNFLFSFIGVLMLSIAGIGFADVKTQLHSTQMLERENREVDGTGNASITEVSTQAVVRHEAEQNTPDSVPAVLADVADRVGMALFDDWEDEDEHEYEYEDKEEDEDDGNDRRSSKQAVSPTPSVAANTNTDTSTGAVSTGGTIFTMVQVAGHSTAASCYSAIDGSVYDLTSFVTKHPGGQSAIKSLCGVDGTVAFNSQHGGEKKATSVLANYKIGILGQ